MPLATIGDLTLGYDDSGGDGPALVLLHAFPVDRRMWAHQRDLPARVVTVDARGFGESGPAPGVLTVEQVADDVASLLDRLGVDRAVVGGASMGGYQAMAFARRHPDRLAGLLLCDTRAEDDTVEQRDGRRETVGALASEGIDVLITRMVPNLLGDTTRARHPSVVEAVTAMIRDQAVDAASAALRGLGARPDATPGLTEVGVPTLVVVGEEDRLTDVDAARRLAALVGGADLVVLPGAGHLSPLEAPERANAAIAGLLSHVAQG